MAKRNYGPVRNDGPFVKPDFIDGKYMKYCEADCGKYIEIAPRASGTQRYCPECDADIRKNYYNANRRVPKDTKVCESCHRRLPLSEFPAGQGRPGAMRACYDCSPFGFRWDRGRVPDCGDWDNDKAEFTPTCPLYDQCFARLKTKVLWLPCTVPIRSQLITVFFAPPDEQEHYLSLLKDRFDLDGKTIIPEDINKYYDYYFKIGAKVLEEQNEQILPVEVDRSIYSGL